ncbi:LuxR C-terminal-related transcriptional regulator [Chloroflexota bacterium]
MNEAEDTKQPSPGIELLATQMARSKTNVAKWDLNIVFLMFALLIIITILVAQGIGINIVAPLAILGLAAVWLIGWRRGRQLYQRFYAEELSSLYQNPNKEAAALVPQLTSREIQILNYVAQGYANKLIALELGISENTVKNFVSGVLTKLNANDRTEAVVIAIKHGLISIR